jgi:hypothetical protein
MTALTPASQGRCEPVTVGILGEAVAVSQSEYLARDTRHVRASCNASEGLSAYQCRAGRQQSASMADRRSAKKLGQAVCER